MIKKRPMNTHVLTFECNSNPAVFNFETVYQNVTGIEVLKTRIVRSERTCEYYRNTPFIVLTNNCVSLVRHDDKKKLVFVNRTGIDPVRLFSLLEQYHDSRFVEVHREHYYDYSSDSLSNEPRNGMCPFVIDSANYTPQTLVEALNSVNAQYQGMHVFAPNVRTSFNTGTGLLKFESDEPFFLVPSNAHTIAGLRGDAVYVAQINTATNFFTVSAHFPPKLDGPDAVFLANNESYPTSFQNTDYVSLATVYFPSQDYPQTNADVSNVLFRPLHVIYKLPRLSLTLYTNLARRFLYQTNGKSWFVELVLRCG